MMLKNRRILFGIFVVLFLCTAVGVLLYANGYRYHSQKRNIEKTGELIIETKPQKSDILLDGRVVYSKTPASIKYVQSGDYRVELFKQGYLPWKMDVSVYSGRSTIIKDIVLFPNNEPRLLIQKNGIRTLGRADGTHLYFATDSELSIYNEQTKTFSVVYKGKSIEQNSIISSPRGGRIVFRDQGMYHVVTVQGGELMTIKDQYDFKNVQWVSEHDLLVVTQTNIFLLPLMSQDRKIVYSGETYDIAVNQDVFALVHGIENSLLMKFSQDKMRFEEVAKLPTSYRVLRGVFEGMVVLSDFSKFNAIYDTNDRNNLLLHLGRGRVIWQSRDRFALINDFELWVYERMGGNFESTLVTRQGNLIDDVVFLDNNPYLLFRTNEKLKAIDMSLHGKLNQYMLNGGFIQASILSHDARSLYSIETVKGKAGLFEYELVPQE